MSLHKILSIWLTSHFKNGVAKTAVTNEKKNQLIYIAGGNAVIFVEKGQSLKMNKIHSINYLFAFFLLTILDTCAYHIIQDFF